MIKAGVIGHPINHSLSPYIHGFWLKEYGIEGTYEAIDVAPENLNKFIKEDMLELGYVGVNITIPYKEKIIPLLDKVGGFAEAIGAVNTIVIEDGKLVGKNTDAYGFIENIKEESNWSFKGNKAVVLGAGGATRAVCAGLLNEDVDHIVIVNRTTEKAEDIKNKLGKRVFVGETGSLEGLIKDADILVNTTSLGMVGKEELEIDLTNLPRESLVADIVYNPLDTGLLKKAMNRGNKIVNGIGMLLHQATPGFEDWFGKRPEVNEDLRKFVLSHL